jgi:hypothetical protein
MISAFAFALLTSHVGKTTDVTAPVVGASVFKNGYVVVTRRIKVGPAGTYALGALTQSAMGTMWFKASEGTSLVSVTTRDISSDYKANVGSLDEIIRNSLGKTLTIGFKNEKGYSEVQGVLKSADGEIYIIETAPGKTVAILKSGLTKVSGATGDLLYSVVRQNVRKVLEFKTLGKAGVIDMLSLERGLSWTAAYAVDISDKKELKLTAKSTLVNDFENLSKVDLKLVTGFPNLPYATVLEPLIAGSGGLDQVRVFAGMPPGSGGFGGGGGVGNMAMGLNTQSAARMGDFDASMAVVTGAGGEQKEDLFFYKLPESSLNRGERAYRAIFSMKSPYSDIYTWDAYDLTQDNVRYAPIPEGPQDVWHALKFKNTSGNPLTTAVATTLDDGEIIGQDMLGYVPAGAETELKINKSLDIRAEATEAEETRERGAIKDRDGNFRFDLVTIKGTLQVTNMKPKDLTFRARRFFTGEVVDNGGGELFKSASGLTRMNPNSQLTWNKQLKAGEKLTLTYTYKMYVVSG